MRTHILCLSLMFLINSVHPFALLQSFTMFPGMEKVDKKKYFERGFLLVLILVVASSMMLIKEMRYIKIINEKQAVWTLVVIGTAILVIVIEMLVEFLRMKIKKVKIDKIEIIDEYKKRDSLTILIIVGIAIMEEVVYRKLWFLILGDYFKINVWIVLIVTSLVYGMNHRGMGEGVLYQKILSGVIFGVAYMISGSILIPICIHVLQNTLIMLVGRR